MNLEALISLALDVRTRGHAPYSRFLVGAALQSVDGQVFSGCNVENASYGLAICAERSAVCQAIAGGATQFSRIVIAAAPLVTPCGACRQFLVEFGTQLQVICVNAENPAEVREWSLEALLPESFHLL